MHYIFRLLFKVYFLIFLFFSFSCKKNVEEVVPDTRIILNIENNEKKPLDGATVAVFDNWENFKLSADQDTVINAVNDTVSVNGKAVLTNLKANTKYWLYAFYKDSNKVKNAVIFYDNGPDNGGKYNIVNPLPKGSETVLETIQLKPESGVITFWVDNNNEDKLPIKLFKDNKQIGTITRSFSAEPVAFTEGTITKVFDKGELSYYAQSSEGKCLWNGSVEVEAASKKGKKLASCKTGRMGFWANEKLKEHLPITIILGTDDTLGTINNSLKNEPLNCQDNDVVSTNRTPGEYEYSAISGKQECIWTRKVNNTNDCDLVKIPENADCN